MSKRSSEKKMIWDLVRSDTYGHDRQVRDDLLLAYRQGTLTETERRSVEEALAGNEAVRQRIYDLAEIDPTQPPAEVRERLFGDLPKPRRLSRRLQGIALSAAALLTLAILGPWLISRDSGPVDMSSLAHSLRLEAIAEQRSVDTTSAIARPDTRVQITLESLGAAQAGVEFAIYRLKGQRLERLEPQRAYTIMRHRGAAVINGRTSDLFGEEAGKHTIYVVASTEARWPDVVELRKGDAAATRLSAATGGLAHQTSVTIERPNAPNAPIGD